MTDKPVEDLLMITEMLIEHQICPHRIEDIITGLLENPKLTHPITARLMNQCCESRSFLAGIQAEMRLAEQKNQTATEVSIGRSMVVGMMLGMLLAISVTESVETVPMIC